MEDLWYELTEQILVSILTISNGIQDTPSTIIKMAAANHASNSFSRKTLFVRGLPYSTSDADLEESFSECGPVKTCFTIKEAGVCLPVWSISGLE